MIKVGSMVRLSRPYESDIYYKNCIGVVERIRHGKIYPDAVVCYTRFIKLGDIEHVTFEIYEHRLDLIGVE